MNEVLEHKDTIEIKMMLKELHAKISELELEIWKMKSHNTYKPRKREND